MEGQKIAEFAHDLQSGLSRHTVPQFDKLPSWAWPVLLRCTPVFCVAPNGLCSGRHLPRLLPHSKSSARNPDIKVSLCKVYY